MAPPNFPNGISLHDIGFAALKYPARPPPPFNVPLGNIVGALQHVPAGPQDHMIAQISSQYLNALLDYQTSDEPTLHDRSLPQYYLSTALTLLNFLTANADVCKHIVARPAIVADIIEKLLDPTFLDGMKSVIRPGGPNFPAATFEEDFGTLLQFISTILLFTDDVGTLDPRANELIPKLRVWKREYKNSRVKTISNASDRLISQIEGTEPMLRTMMRSSLNQKLICGVPSCRINGPTNLTACSGCRIQRYCGKDHQKVDWKYHKHICNKGLMENEPTTTASEGGSS